MVWWSEKNQAGDHGALKVAPLIPDMGRDQASSLVCSRHFFLFYSKFLLLTRMSRSMRQGWYEASMQPKFVRGCPAVNSSFVSLLGMLTEHAFSWSLFPLVATRQTFIAPLVGPRAGPSLGELPVSHL